MDPELRLPPGVYLLWSDDFTGADKFVRQASTRDGAGVVTFGGQYYGSAGNPPGSLDSSAYRGATLSFSKGAIVTLEGAFTLAGAFDEIAVYDGNTMLGTAERVDATGWRFTSEVLALGNHSLVAVIQPAGATDINMAFGRSLACDLKV